MKQDEEENEAEGGTINWEVVHADDVREATETEVEQAMNQEGNDRQDPSQIMPEVSEAASQ